MNVMTVLSDDRSSALVGEKFIINYLEVSMSTDDKNWLLVFNYSDKLVQDI